MSLMCLEVSKTRNLVLVLSLFLLQSPSKYRLAVHLTNWLKAL